MKTLRLICKYGGSNVTAEQASRLRHGGPYKI
jgi:hypothetical protein